MTPGITPKTYYTTNIDQISKTLEKSGNKPSSFSLDTPIRLENLYIDHADNMTKNDYVKYAELVNHLTSTVPTTNQQTAANKLTKLCEWAHLHINNDLKTEVAKHLGCKPEDLSCTCTIKPGTQDRPDSPIMYISFNERRGAQSQSISLQVRQDSETGQPTALMWKVVGTEDKRSVYRWIVDLLNELIGRCPMDAHCKISFETVAQQTLHAQYPLDLSDIKDFNTPEMRVRIDKAMDILMAKIFEINDNDKDNSDAFIKQLLDQTANDIVTQHMRLMIETTPNESIKKLIEPAYMQTIEEENQAHGTMVTLSPSSSMRILLHTTFTQEGIIGRDIFAREDLLLKRGTELAYNLLRNRFPPDLQATKQSGQTGKIPSFDTLKSIIEKADQATAPQKENLENLAFARLGVNNQGRSYARHAGGAFILTEENQNQIV